MIEDCFPAWTRLTELQWTATLKLFVDADSNVYDVADGTCVASSLIASSSAAQETPSCVVIHRWVLDGRVLVAVDEQRTLYAIRLADRKVQAANRRRSLLWARSVSHNQYNNPSARMNAVPLLNST